MAIKSKNKWSTYNSMVVLFLAALLSICTIVDVVKHRSYLRSDAYFQSDAFIRQFEIHFNLIRYTIDNHKYPYQTDDEKIGKERSASWQQTYTAMAQQSKNNIRNTYNDKMMEAQSLDKPDEVKRLEQEAASRIAEVDPEIAKLLEIRKSQYLAYKEREFTDVKNSLDARSGTFHYYIKDTRDGQLYTNMQQAPTDTDMKQAFYMIQLPQSKVSPLSLMGINKYFQQNRLEGYLIIPQNLNGFNQFQADIEYFHSIRERLFKEIGVFSVAGLIIGFLLWHFKRNTVFATYREEQILSWLRRIPLDARLLLAVIAAGICLSRVGSNSFFQLPLSLRMLTEWVQLGLASCFIILCIIDGIRLNADREQLRAQWMRSLYCQLLALFTSRLIPQSILFKAGVVFLSTVLLGLFTVCGLLGIAREAGRLIFFSAVYIGLYALTILPYVIRKIKMLGLITTGVEQMAAGNLNEPIQEHGRGNLSSLARHLNSMKNGLKLSLENEMKSERMKTELITNVSHDLKTPLTSIINYVDLLKQKDLPPDQAKSYIEVLDRKSQRLKVLIDDLFEASKMSSGAVELTMETVNVSALLDQALAEFSDRIEASELSFRVSIQHPQITACLDGRKTWRVFENLISNAVKYSMPRSRVHLSLTEDHDMAYFTIKNVSAYELEFEPEELFERFKRGDQSRHTEGSGLGLAIAKSIVELQGGDLRIEIDGDLFKVTVIFNKR